MNETSIPAPNIRSKNMGTLFPKCDCQAGYRHVWAIDGGPASGAIAIQHSDASITLCHLEGRWHEQEMMLNYLYSIHPPEYVAIEFNSSYHRQGKMFANAIASSITAAMHTAFIIGWLVGKGIPMFRVIQVDPQVWQKWMDIEDKAEKPKAPKEPKNEKCRDEAHYQERKADYEKEWKEYKKNLLTWNLDRKRLIAEQAFQRLPGEAKATTMTRSPQAFSKQDDSMGEIIMSWGYGDALGILAWFNDMRKTPEGMCKINALSLLERQAHK